MPGLIHTGFVQPSEMDNFVRRGGVFVLPSTYEPWGVVLHEFAASGYPLITTEAVGAASAFLESDGNGIMVKTGRLVDLRSALESFANLSDEDLWRMARHSARLGQKMTQKGWIETALKILE
jgi:glycosyltransferase involved in cell wall biosynthesis